MKHNLQTSQFAKVTQQPRRPWCGVGDLARLPVRRAGTAQSCDELCLATEILAWSPASSLQASIAAPFLSNCMARLRELLVAPGVPSWEGTTVGTVSAVRCPGCVRCSECKT